MAFMSDNNKNVSVLFTQVNSNYYSLGVDCWDKKRNALLFRGNNSVVCHPPCRSWGRLSHFAKPAPGEEELAFFSIDLIRKNGGVLEHPRSSKLWPAYLPYPGQYDDFGGYTISIDQFWFGHKCVKSTFLYIVGCPISLLPKYPLRFDVVSHVIAKSSGSPVNHKKEVSKKEREATPLNLAKWLIAVATLCNKHINI